MNSNTEERQLLQQIDDRLKRLEIQQIEANARLDAYQKAANQVVNLAYSLILSATITIIISAVLRK